MPVCKKPFRDFRCGQCMPCMIYARRLWSHRLELESHCHAAATFVTLTYAEMHLPLGGTLVPRHADLWRKAFAEAYRRATGLKIRYVHVGEYGDENMRPHYHFMIWGYPNCVRGATEHRYQFCCPNCAFLQKFWKYGSVDLQECNEKTCQYIVGYVTKKMTRWNDKRLNGRHPEYKKSSNRPGIGAYSMKQVAISLSNIHGHTFIDSTGDVPMFLQHGNRKKPLGRYLRRKLREEMGFINTGDQSPDKIAKEKEMFALQPDQWLTEKTAEYQKKEVERLERDQKVLNIEAKYKILNQPKRKL